MLYCDIVKSNINKKIADTLKNDWNKFWVSLTALEILLKDMKIEVSRFAGSWNVLLPIIYFIYFNSAYKNHITLYAHICCGWSFLHIFNPELPVSCSK